VPVWLTSGCSEAALCMGDVKRWRHYFQGLCLSWSYHGWCWYCIVLYHLGSSVDEPPVEVPAVEAGAAAAAGSPPESLDVILLQKPKTPLQSAISNIYTYIHISIYRYIYIYRYVRCHMCRVNYERKRLGAAYNLWLCLCSHDERKSWSRSPQRQLRYIEWKGVKIYDF